MVKSPLVALGGNNPINYVSSHLNSLSGYIDDLLGIGKVNKEIEKHFGDSMLRSFQKAQQLKNKSDYTFIVSGTRHLLPRYLT
ncbi:MAG: hypothetical protein WCL27_05280 [Betaproteobacteria bacterium]